MRCGFCRGDRYVIVNGLIGCAACGETAPYGFAMNQLVLPDDACVREQAVNRIALRQLERAFVTSHEDPRISIYDTDEAERGR
jgi:hypothetical protein